MVLCINLVVSYLISFPLMMGEGKEGGDIIHLPFVKGDKEGFQRPF